jgi:hypothetical protein
LRQAFGAAQAAAGAAGQTAPMQLERLGTLGGELHAHFNALRLFDDFEIEDFAGAADDALAEAEAEREIFKFAGGGQHHGMRNSVVHQSHRHFLGEDFGTGKSARRRAPAGRVAAMGLLIPCLLRRASRLAPPCGIPRRFFITIQFISCKSNLFVSY